MIKTFDQDKGLQVVARAPAYSGRNYSVDLTSILTQYNHTRAAIGGYADASISLSVSENDAIDWVLHGLGRDIATFSNGNTVWEGFVNQIQLTVGGVTITVGPMSNIANRVSAMYTPIIDDTVSPVITGIRTETVIVEDTVSQDKYGIWEKIISAGTVLDDDAEYIRNVFLSDNKDPEKNTTISVGGGEALSVTLICRGYCDWLNFAYNDANPLSVQASTKIANIVAAEPNSIFSSDVGRIAFNGILVSAYEGDNRLAIAIVEEIASMGDINDVRWIYGCDSGRRFYYRAVSTSVDYAYYVSDNPDIRTISGHKLDPWDVVPGKLVVIPDIITGINIADNITLDDPRVVLVEQAVFTAPYSLEIHGGKLLRLPQLLARLGIGG